MDFAGLSDERGAGSVATRSSSGTRERRARSSRRSMVRFEPIDGGQGNPVIAPAMADHRQADYFLRLLAQSRRLSEHRIDQYQTAIAVSESNGDVEAVASFRRMVCREEHDRQTLDGLMEKLRQRFASGAPGEVATKARKGRVAAR